MKALRKATWMTVAILFSKFDLSKAICDLRLALTDLKEFDEELERKREKLTWTVAGYGDDNGTELLYQLSWAVEYGWWERPLQNSRPLATPSTQ